MDLFSFASPFSLVSFTLSPLHVLEEHIVLQTILVIVLVQSCYSLGSIGPQTILALHSLTNCPIFDQSYHSKHSNRMMQQTPTTRVGTIRQSMSSVCNKIQFPPS